MTDKSAGPNDAPTIEELQKKIVTMTSELDALKQEKATADSVKTQYEALQKKYDDLVQTNMSLIRAIPDASAKGTDERRPKDLNAMSEQERYDYLKDLAQKSFEKKE